MAAERGSGKRPKKARLPDDTGILQVRPNPQTPPVKQSLRLLAEVTYVTDLRGMSIEQLGKQPPFDQISVDKLYRWAAAGAWVKKRQEYFETIKKRIADQIASSIVQTRVRQLKMVDALTEKAKLKLDSGDLDDLDPSMIGAFVKLVGLSDKLREKVGDKLIPDRFSETSEMTERPRMKAQISSAEAREMALMLIRQRRAQIRAQLAAPQPPAATAGKVDGQAVD